MGSHHEWEAQVALGALIICLQSVSQHSKDITCGCQQALCEKKNKRGRVGREISKIKFI